jgi:multisubunit Na+/H+ antiporter MnhF subunit
MQVLARLALHTAWVMLGVAAVATVVRNAVGRSWPAWVIAIALAIGIFVMFMSRVVLSYS